MHFFYAKFLTGLFGLMSALTFVQAQPEYKTLDINNIEAKFYSSGDFFWHPDHEEPGFEVPAGEDKHTLFNANIWMAGFDEEENAYLSAQAYRQERNEYQAGPHHDEEQAGDNHSNEWDEVWKITNEEIEQFKNGEDTAEVILNWPAHGNTDIGEAEDLAPFVDVSETGQYEPQKGDYPEMKGDMMLWWVFNDLPEAGNPAVEPLGLEIQVKAYGYEDPTDLPELLDNTLFIELEVHNRSDNDYEDVHLGKFIDFDIGNPFNNYIGSFPEVNTIFSYVAEDEDEVYGEDPPAQSVTFLDQDLDYFMYYRNTFDGTTGNPTEAEEFFNLLQGNWLNGISVCYGGDGAGNCWDRDREVDHVFTDDPSLPANNQENWSEESADRTPGDRRGLGSFEVGDFNSGESLTLSQGFIYQYQDEGDRLESASEAKSNADQLQDFFDTEIATSTIDPEPKAHDISIAPNPAGDIVRIKAENRKIQKVRIMDLSGKVLSKKTFASEAPPTKSVNHLRPGLYLIEVDIDGEKAYERIQIK